MFLISLAGLALGMRWQSYFVLIVSSILFLWGLAFVFLPEDYGASAEELRKIDLQRRKEEGHSSQD